MSGLIEAPNLVDALARAMTGDTTALSNPWDSLDPSLDMWADPEQKKWWDGELPQTMNAAPQLQTSEAQNPLLKQQRKSAEQTGELPVEQATDIRRWTKAHQNGHIPLGALEKVGNEYLRPDVASAMKSMIRAAKKDGVNLSLVSGYRSFEEQSAIWDNRDLTPGPEARPGTSNHGWGIAADLNVSAPGVSQWLQEHSQRFGFANLQGDPEHFDYHATPGTEVRPTKTAFGPRRKSAQAYRGASLNKIDVGSPTRLAWATSAPQAFVDIYTMPRTAKRTPQQVGFGANLPDFVPKRYKSLIADAARGAGISARLFSFVVRLESAFNPKAVSSAGALGLAQLMPYNAEGIDPYDPQQNLERGATILAGYIHRMGSIRNGLAAYNAGPGNYQAGLGYADRILGEVRSA